MLWARLLAYVSGTVDQELLLRNEYLAAENRILRGQIQGRLLLSEGEKATLAEIAQRLGRKVLDDVAAAAKPDTILGWYRKLIANKFDGSKFRRSVGRPKVDQETERLVVKMARENPSWVRPSMRRRFNFDDRQRTSHSFAHPSVDSTLKQAEVERLSQRAA